jgi:hypothetical protein
MPLILLQGYTSGWAQTEDNPVRYDKKKIWMNFMAFLILARVDDIRNILKPFYPDIILPG